MRVPLTSRVKVTALDEMMFELQVQLDSARSSIRNLTLTPVVALVVVLVGVVAVSSFEGDSVAFALVAGFIGLVAVSIFTYARYLGARRKRDKVVFATELLELLWDELHPKSRVRLRLDLRHYDVEGKEVWRGRSSHGNPKFKYSDKWLVLRGILADRTRIQVRCQAGVKVKKGSVVKEKRRLFLDIRPNWNRYDRSMVASALKPLRWKLEAAVRQAFHNPPEDFSVSPSLEGERLTIKVTQEDAPILPGEIMALVDGVVAVLDKHRLRRAG